MIYQDHLATNNYNHKNKNHSMSENATFPGEKIASIEEYEADTMLLMMEIWSEQQLLGQKDIDKTTRTANIKHPKNLSIPKVGDVVIGTVAAVMSSMIAVSIDYINGNPTTSKVECVCSTRNIRKRNVALVNDIAKLKILSHLNGTIHATIDESSLGILLQNVANVAER